MNYLDFDQYLGLCSFIMKVNLHGFDLELQCEVICTRSNQYVTMQQVNRHKKFSLITLNALWFLNSDIVLCT